MIDKGVRADLGAFYEFLDKDLSDAGDPKGVPDGFGKVADTKDFGDPAASGKIGRFYDEGSCETTGRIRLSEMIRRFISLFFRGCFERKGRLDAVPEERAFHGGLFREHRGGINGRPRQVQRFADRCEHCMERCRTEKPARWTSETGHYSTCHYSMDEEFVRANAPRSVRHRDIVGTPTYVDQNAAEEDLRIVEAAGSPQSLTEGEE